MFRRFARRGRRRAGVWIATAALATGAAQLGTPETALALPAERLSLLIGGRVFDHTGKPVKRATVMVESAHAASTATNDDGNYTLELPLDGLRESAPHTVAFALHVQHARERFTLADGSDTVRVEVAVAPGDGGAKVLMRSNSEAALTALLGAFKTSSGRGDFRGDHATAVAVQLLFFGRASDVGAASDIGMPFQDSAFLEGVVAAAPPAAAPSAMALGAATVAPAPTAAIVPPAATTPASAARSRTHAATPTPAPAPTSASATTRAPAVAADSAVSARAGRATSPDHAPAASSGSEAHLIGGSVSTTGTMSKIFSSPAGAIPLLTPSAPDSAARARALSPCECHVEGTVEVSWNRPLPHPFHVVIWLADEPTVRDTAVLFMGPPRPFTLLHVPCGAHRIEVGVPKPEHFTLSGSAASRTADCARGTARAVRLVLVRRAETTGND